MREENMKEDRRRRDGEGKCEGRAPCGNMAMEGKEKNELRK